MECTFLSLLKYPAYTALGLLSSLSFRPLKRMIFSQLHYPLKHQFYTRLLLQIYVSHRTAWVPSWTLDNFPDSYIYLFITEQRVVRLLLVWNTVGVNFNPLHSKGNYSSISNNMKLVHWLLMSGLLHLVQRGEAWGAAAPPRPLLAVPNTVSLLKTRNKRTRRKEENGNKRNIIVL